MSKKNKSVCVKLIANPGAGKTSDAPNRLKLVTGYLKANGLKVDVALVKAKEKATPIARKPSRLDTKLSLPWVEMGRLKLS